MVNQSKKLKNNNHNNLEKKLFVQKEKNNAVQILTN